MIKVVSFDCWGALVDWEAGVQTFVTALMARPHTSEVARPSVEEWLARWRRIRRQLLKPYRPWRELLVRSYDATMQVFGMEAFVDDGPELARQVAALEPRAEARPTLRRLAKKYRLAIVSNADREALAQALGQLQAPFSSVVTAEDVSAYKPDAKLFELLLERLGVAPGEVMHVAASAEEDAQPARAAGMRTALVGPSGDADLIAPSLAELVEKL